jgi:hypothetical protein
LSFDSSAAPFAGAAQRLGLLEQAEKILVVQPFALA